MTKILVIAYDLNPRIGSEAGAAYIWSSILAKDFRVVAFTQEFHQTDLEQSNSKLNTRFIKVTPFLSRFLTRFHLYNLDYALFIKKVKRVIQAEIEPGNTILHFLTPCGIHSFNSLAEDLNLPYIIGPIGGYLKLPAGFEAYRTKSMCLKEFFYSILVQRNDWQRYFIGAKAIVCGTDLVKAHLPQKAQEKTFIIHDAVIDADYYSPSGRGNESKTAIKIAFTGRLENYKGIFLLLDAFAAVVKKYPDATLVYAGTGSQYSQLTQKVIEYDLQSSVRVLGRIDRAALKELLLTSDIYCLPTLKEPGGTALLEAMACELPVITSNYGGPANSVTPECGILIDPISITDHVNKIAAGIELLISNPALRRRMGIAGRQRVVENYSPQALEKSISNFYHRTVSESLR